MMNIKATQLKNGFWKTRFYSDVISGCEKETLVSDVTRTIREGNNFIAYDQDDKIVMFKIHKGFLN